MIKNRKTPLLNLPIVDVLQKQFLGVNIFSLPTKGTLYQRNRDGSIGAPITSIYQRSAALAVISSTQYATKVANCSSFWGGSLSWSPLQALGPQNCPNVVADCVHAWSPLTELGTGGFASGSGQGLKYGNDPDARYNELGYTEYLELLYDHPVYPTAVLIGENRGMGAMKNILAKDPYGNWMTLYKNPNVDDSVKNYYTKYNQYRIFVPDICLPPFPTNHLRFEMDTRDVSDWNEYDFFELQGISNTSVDYSAVNFYGNAQWNVFYVPNPTASGIDSFTYSAR